MLYLKTCYEKHEAQKSHLHCVREVNKYPMRYQIYKEQVKSVHMNYNSNIIIP